MVILDFLVETIVKSSSHTQKDTKYDRGGVKMLHPASHRLAGCNILKRPATLLCLFVSFCVCKEDCPFGAYSVLQFSGDLHTKSEFLRRFGTCDVMSLIKIHWSKKFRQLIHQALHRTK